MTSVGQTVRSDTKRFWVSTGGVTGHVWCKFRLDRTWPEYSRELPVPTTVSTFRRFLTVKDKRKEIQTNFLRIKLDSDMRYVSLYLLFQFTQRVYGKPAVQRYFRLTS